MGEGRSAQAVSGTPQPYFRGLFRAAEQERCLMRTTPRRVVRYARTDFLVSSSTHSANVTVPSKDSPVGLGSVAVTLLESERCSRSMSIPGLSGGLRAWNRIERSRQEA